MDNGAEIIYGPHANSTGSTTAGWYKFRAKWAGKWDGQMTQGTRTKGEMPASGWINQLKVYAALHNHAGRYNPEYDPPAGGSAQRWASGAWFIGPDGSTLAQMPSSGNKADSKEFMLTCSIPLPKRALARIRAPILGTVQVKRCKTEARALSRGEPIAPILTRLDRYAKGSSAKADEARELAAAVRTYVDRESKRLIALGETRPAYAALRLGKLFNQVKGLPEQEMLWQALKPLVEDKELVKLVQMIKACEKVRAELVKRSKSKSLKTKLDRIKGEFRDYALSPGPSQQLKAEASTLAEEL